MARVQARTEAALERVLPSAAIAPQRLHEAMRYAVLGGGKRIRPLLVFAAGEAAAGDAEPADSGRLEVLACALECIHAYSLVHDDLPCMDDDVLRRGKPACHVEFDEATALLVGDSLQSLAFQLVAEHRVCDDPAVQVDMLKILAVACGSRGMAGGQAIDLASVGQSLSVPELEYMHIHKTGALIRAAVALGARASQAIAPVQLEHLDRYAKCVGLAFQVVDDVLDQESSTATLGKTVGKDAANNKPTYVSALGLARAKSLAEELRGDAHEAIAPLGSAAQRLRDLADFVVLRKF
ncbi:MAG TPA: farnesyl diphosphate synthase [Burkholderiales bacterium]|nr:farnesyl diphosphate synthase [Burkholderiales bacterium]